MNHKSISSPGSNYHYRSYIEKLCNYGSDSKKTHLTSSLYYEDDHENMDEFDKNSGSVARMNRMNSDGSLEMLGFLHSDISNLNKLMLNNMNIRFKLYRNKPSFSILTSQKAAGEYKVHIKDAVLLVRKVNLNPNVALANEMFLKKSNARYALERTEIKTFTIPAATTTHTIDNCFISQMPKRILLMSVEEDCEFNYEKNGYNFKHHNIGLVMLTGDHFQQIRPIKTNYKQNEFVEAYSALHDALNIYFQDTSVAITPEQFKASCNVVGFDLTNDMQASAAHASIGKSGVLRLQLQYTKPLEKSLKLIVYAEYNNYLNIDANREVFTDYAC